MENNQWEEQADITRFLEKFDTEPSTEEFNFPSARQAVPTSLPDDEQEQSFQQLEEKIQELEEKFAASAAQNEAVMQELVRTRKAVENQKSKDEFFANIATTIANLKQSVENLSRAQEEKSLYENPAVTRKFDTPATTNYQPDNFLAMQQAKLQLAEEAKKKAVSDLNTAREEKEKAQIDLYTERAEKEQVLSALHQEQQSHIQTRADAAEKSRVLSSLLQKASQLKAVNVALDREIKRAQQERTEALRKSAEQAKEILSLRDALTAAEERFKSFDFDGRIISIKRQYEQKVNTLETQLREISTTCMKQVEEIESLKTENLRLQRIAEEREQLAALYEAKTRELEALRASVLQLRTEQNNERLAEFNERMEHLQQEHTALSQRLTQAQEALLSVSSEKQALEENFQALLSKIAKNDEIILSLRKKIAVLTEENMELKKGQTGAKITLRKPFAPRTTAVKSQTKPQAPAAPQLAKDKTVEPVEMQNTQHSSLKTEDDLPEIRVAEPMPQDDIYNGEDFLEKTDSFIGRMKWSIFREDK